MGLPSLLWLDATDFYRATALLRKIRQQASDWDWISWHEGVYEGDKQEAYLSLCREIGISSILLPGKVVCCWHIPSFHVKLVTELERISDNVLFILVVTDEDRKRLKLIPSKFALYQKALELSKKDKDRYKVEIPASPEKLETFVIERASIMGLKMDEKCAVGLIEFVGTDLDMLTTEIRKLAHFCDGGVCTLYAIQQACYLDGQATPIRLANAILANRKEVAHEMLERLIVNNTEGGPVGIMAFLAKWARKLAIARSGDCDYNSIKPYVEKLRERKADAIGPMYEKPGQLFYSCQELSSFKGRADWPYYALNEVVQSGIRVKMILKDEDGLKKYLHEMLEDLFESMKELKSLKHRRRRFE